MSELGGGRREEAARSKGVKKWRLVEGEGVKCFKDEEGVVS
jgi:hypothetical protein